MLELALSNGNCFKNAHSSSGGKHTQILAIFMPEAYIKTHQFLQMAKQVPSSEYD